jgi:hypothetical protein
MTKLKRSAFRSLVLGGLALLAVVVCHLALTDIGHVEGDLTGEWRVLQIGFLVIIAALVSTVATGIRVMRA